MNDRTLSLRLSAAELKALRRRARLEGVSQGSLIRRALQAYGVTSPPQRGEKSFYDLAKPVLGRYRAKSKDLSTNPEHLADYGR